MLNRALENDGRVSRADYEQAWRNYRQCMVAKGYTEDPLPRYGDGLYASTSGADTKGMTEEERNKFREDWIECRSDYVLYVDELYRAAVGNQTLLVEPAAGTVQCLRQKELVPSSYTPKRFTDEQGRYYDLLAKYREEGAADASARAAREAFSIDLGNAGVMTCLVANGWDPPVDGQQRWKPLG